MGKSVKEMIGLKELRDLVLWRDAVVELVATFCLLAVGAAVGLDLEGGHRPPEYAIGIAVAFLVYGLIECNDHLSGGFLNPVVPFSLACCQHISVVRAVVLSVAECGGAIAGSGFIWGMTNHTHQIGPVHLHPSITPTQGFFLEVEQTFLLIYVVYGATDAKYKTVRIPSMAIGFVLGMNIMVFGKLTGGCMNPALAFGPAVVANKWEHHWVYWAGPYLGGFLAFLFYKVFCVHRIFMKRRTESVDICDKEEEDKPRDGGTRLTDL